MSDIDELIPGHNLAVYYSNCGTRIMQYKMLYTDNTAMGGLIDTSVIGQRAFDTIIYNVIDLEKRVFPYIAEGRYRIERNIKQMDSIIGVNNKIRDSIELARAQKKL